MSILIKGIDMPKEGRLKIEITSDHIRSGGVKCIIL